MRYWILFFLFFLSSLYGRQEDLLTKEDIFTTMEEILEQHVSKKEMTEEIMQQALMNYIDAFDPHRVYLLESEVAPFLSPASRTIKKYIVEYQQHKYFSFEMVNTVIQKAIERSRRLREGLERDVKGLFSKELLEKYRHYQLPASFAKTKADLKERMQYGLVLFIEEEKERFGETAVMEKQGHILRLYEEEKKEQEDPYLFLDDMGDPLSLKEKDHVFALHVLKAMTKSLDSHSSFFDTTEAFDMKMRLQKGYIGIGIVFEDSLNGPLVKSIQPHTPASTSTIQPGDLLVGIDGQSMVDEPFKHVMEKIEGEEGVPIRLQLRRENFTFNAELKRAQIAVQQDRVEVKSFPFEGGEIGVITLHSFYQGEEGISSEKDVKAAIDQLRLQGPLRGIILDLRENAGGYLSQAVKVAGLFITSGIIVVSKYADGERHYYRDMDGIAYYDGPIVVLTSRWTASAAEIVAQALQDYGVAVIVGDDRTYGKGSIQSQNVTEGKGASLFKVTVGRYYTVSGRTPQVEGVLSDIQVPGVSAFENVGEQFVDRESHPDTIEPSYRDTLGDVRPDIKNWFMRYYLPTIQNRKTFWHTALPALKSKSEQRRALHSKNLPYTSDEQVHEAVFIIEDMIKIKVEEREGQIGRYD